MSLLGKRLSDTGVHELGTHGVAKKKAKTAIADRSASIKPDLHGSVTDSGGTVSRRSRSVVDVLTARSQNYDDADMLAPDAIEPVDRETTGPNEADQEARELELFQQEHAEALDASELKAGAIEQVELVNFMCHDHFSIKLGPRLNIIIGQNGSGKSAILTAMTIALGAKASATSRATTFKNFVKHERSFATVRIVLSNEGDEAYRPDVYGEKIIIERRIRSDGPATWKIQDQAGKTIETTAAELHTICDQFNLQMDNPINVLTQDLARQFLQSNDPKRLYQLYLDGTQLNQLTKEVDLIKVNLSKMEVQLVQHERAKERLEQALQDAKNQWERVQEARGYQSKIDDLKNECAWSLVAEKKESLDRAIQATEHCRKKRDTYEAKLGVCLESLKEVGERIDSLEEQTNVRARESAPVTAQRDELKKRIADKRAEREREKAKEHELANQKSTLRREIDDLQSRIDAETAKLQGDGRKRREELELKQHEARQKLDDLEDQRTERQEELARLEEQRIALSLRVTTAESERDDLRRQADNLDAYARNLRATSQNVLAAFGGSEVPRLLQLIEQDKGWRRKPIGPLGRHLKLKDMQWADVLESVIGNVLNAYFVTCHEDRARLDRYLRQLRLSKSMILTGSEELFDFSAGEPSADVLTILRVLEIDNEIVKRALVNSVHIERAALVSSRAEGDQFMRTRPMNVQSCFSKDLYSLKGGMRGSSSIALARHNGVPRFASSNKVQMQETAQQRAEIERQLVQANEIVGRAGQERAEVDRTISMIRREQLPALHHQIQRIKQELHGIEDELKEDEPANTRALEEAKEETEAQAQRNVQEFIEVQTRKEKVEAEIAKLEEERQRLRKTLEANQRGVGDLEERILEATEKRVKLSSDREHWQRKLDASKASLEAAEAREDELTQDVDEAVEGASELCDEVETERSPDEIMKEINKLKERQSRANKETGVSVDQAERELEDAKEKRDRGEEQYHLMNSLKTILQTASAKRWHRIHAFKRSTATRTKHLFSLHLIKRGYTGSLVFDHVAQTLNMAISTNDRGRGSKMGDPKALSGGERSYTTTSLLLSLWQAIKSPIRCLDEFDVYMDTFNRKIALELLMAETTAYKNVQYILITPLELPGNINVDRDGVVIHQLAAPERGENVLAG